METQSVLKPTGQGPFKASRGTRQTPKRGSKTLTTLIAGGGAGLIEGLTCHPLDTIKVKMQLGQKYHQGVRLGVFQTGYQIAKHDSLSAFYRGLGPVLLGIVPKIAVRFTSFEAYKSLLSDSKPGPLSDQRLLIAALSAGVTEAVMVVTPMDVIKIRLQAQRLGNYDRSVGPRERTLTLLRGLRREGLGSLYSGMGLTALRQGTNQAANLFTYTKAMKALRDWQPQYRDSSLPIHQVSLAGLLAGSMGPLFNAPIDTLKTRVQQGPRIPGKSSMSQILDITRSILHTDGVSGLYKGVLPRILRVGVGQAVTFPVYEFLSRVFEKGGYKA